MREELAGELEPSSQDVGDAIEKIMVHLFSAQLLRAGLKLGLPDAFGDDPVAPDQLARRVGADPAVLHRLLRALASIGVFQATTAGRYTHSPLSRILQSSDAGLLLGQAATVDALWQAWSSLDTAVRSGDGPFRALHGTDFYTYLSEYDPEQSATFHAAMNEATALDNDDVVGALDLTAVSRLVDVGGGQGGLLRDLLRHNRHLQGVLFDTESVVGNAVPELSSGELADRCEIVAGDARETVPAGAEAYLLRLVLHNWDDESCVRILAACARAARPGARVFVVETVLPADRLPSATEAMMDMGMFVTFGSGERTEAEFAKLFDRAGLAYVGLTPTPSFSILEARVGSGG
ncbi:methyltransferase [Longimycelium tulufanense]|uniref:Methyltransferase n=1 Tax=Longimycelium tulufanense TaxID=907463 RepID=A0A8J3C7M8_9PSEU|nr:methyltransferase [Longimycelium tulufanense]GGM36360.1 methyltransferase [Longimycelium tulufanense]